MRLTILLVSLLQIKMVKNIESIREFFKSVINIFIALFKVLIQSKFNLVFPKQQGDNIAFLGNGPSLDDALIKIKKDGLPENIMVTNFFCNTAYFKLLKPNHYTICDPLFNYEGYKKDDRISNFYKAIYTVDWELNVFFPYFFKKDISKIIKAGNLENKKVKIYYYNSVNFNGGGDFLLSLMHQKLGMSRPKTVAIPALYNCMYMGYTNISIAGVDLNQHLDITIGRDNKLKLKYRHFYNKGEVIDYKPWYNSDGVTYKTSEIFLVFHHFFSSFDVLALYAKKYNVEIINYSEESYLDQFKKK